jgi:hypothetical protein
LNFKTIALQKSPLRGWRQDTDSEKNICKLLYMYE